VGFAPRAWLQGAISGARSYLCPGGSRAAGVLPKYLPPGSTDALLSEPPQYFSACENTATQLGYTSLTNTAEGRIRTAGRRCRRLREGLEGNQSTPSTLRPREPTALRLANASPGPDKTHCRGRGAASPPLPVDSHLFCSGFCHTSSQAGYFTQLWRQTGFFSCKAGKTRTKAAYKGGC